MQKPLMHRIPPISVATLMCGALAFEEFTGPVGSRLPSPVVTLKAAAGK